jgi:hypothetical protein
MGEYRTYYAKNSLLNPNTCIINENLGKCLVKIKSRNLLLVILNNRNVPVSWNGIKTSDATVLLTSE